MKQEDRRQQTIQLLLQSTKVLIAEKGCHAFTLKDIMDKSGLSKGAIFHYVKSKDEIFAWVLQERLEETNERFMNEVKQESPSFDGPMQQIVGRFASLSDTNDVTNKVLMYLLGKEDQPAVAQALNQFYEQSVHYAKLWITTGQQHAVISAAVDAGKTAELFVLLSLGIRMRTSMPQASSAFHIQDYSAWMTQILNPHQ
ncbi:TetR family transcriptional regulator [Paenibacillus ferrarius]|uniref:TetR family transcriptional regulator n=1 Tax=Paenibacillus ferrarius TaxID=1469647 RepID=A0A1V4HMY3_9BACL|nr:TetR/AcrR family transcriptional regulator [Paenibacillus ferrarius]OPH59039.1 TetR family transcriptional regulator [Paenibacillus ferrarius]